MNTVAVLGGAVELCPIGDGRGDAELLAPVVAQALGAAGVTREQIGIVCSAGSEFLNGVVGSMMDSYDVVPGWPPRTQSHLEGDGAFALYEAWARLLAGEAQVALVCAYSRPLAAVPSDLLKLQLDPYLVAPLGPDGRQLAALQARALLDTGRYGESDFAAVTAQRRGMDVDGVLAAPYVATPLREADCSTPCAGAAALVLTTAQRASRAEAEPAWVTGIDQRVETAMLGNRDLARSTSIEAAAARLGLRGSAIDVLEVHAPFSYQELLVAEAIGAEQIGACTPSGGVLAADALTVSGLARVIAAAESVRNGEARRAVAHATNGPCLQHNLLCLLEADR